MLHARFIEVCVVGVHEPVPCSERMTSPQLLGARLRSLLPVFCLHGGKS